MSFPVITIDAGLDGWAACGVETLESVDAGDAEFDLEPNPVVKLMPPAVKLVAGVVVWVLPIAEGDIGLNSVRGGDVARVTAGVDKVEVVPAINGVGAAFSSIVGDKGFGPVGVSAFRIGMSLILGEDADEEEMMEFALVLPKPLLT